MPGSNSTSPRRGTPAPRQGARDENTEIVAAARQIVTLPTETDDERAERERQAVRIVRAVTSNGHSELARKQVRDLFRTSKILTATDFDRLAREAIKAAPLAGGPHPVNVSDDGYTYSTGRAHGSCSKCAAVPRGLYQGARYAGLIPELHAQPVHGEGASRQSEYLLSKTDGSARVSIPGEEIESGKWSFRIGMPRSADRSIGYALASVILYHLAAEAPEVPAFPSAELRDETGHLYIPVPECLPAGYTIRPTGGDDETAATAGRRIAEIVAANPKTALALGMAVDAPYVSATRRQPSWVMFYGGKRQGKTTVLFLAASVWGKVAPPTPGPDQVVRSWDATTKGPGRFLGQLGILPAFLDETGTADFADVDWARMNYGTTQGGSRMQAESRGMGSRATPGWRGRMFLTGNDMICDGLDGGKFDGISARLLQLSAPFTRNADECEELESLVTRWHGWLGPAVLAAYTPEDWTGLLTAAGELIGIPAGGGARTLGKDLSGGVAGAMAVDAILGTGTLLADAALIAAREYLDAHRSEGKTPGQRMVEAVRSSMALHPSAWASRKAYEEWQSARDPQMGDAWLPRHGLDRQLLGVYDDDLLYVEKAAWKGFAESEGVGPTAPLAELHAAGILNVPSARRKRGEWAGKMPRWAGGSDSYRLRLASVQDSGADDGDQDQEPGPGAPAAPESPAAPEPVADPWAGERAAMEVARQDPLPAADTPATVTPESPGTPAPGDWLAATFARKDNARYFRTEPERAALKRIVGLLDENPNRDDKDAVRSLTTRLHLLAELEGSGKEFGGPFLPRARGASARIMPWKKTGLPPVVEMARVIEGYDHRRDYHGEVAAFDRNGAWIGSIGTTLVAHGALAHTGECEPAASSTTPGYYQVNVYPWTETDMPAPLGTAEPGTPVWVTAPVMGLLASLAQQGRWPDATALDSWTGEPVRLAEWGRLIRETRRYALETYGYGSGAYQAAKDAFSTAVSLMNGTLADDSAQPVRVWKKCKIQRIDWRHQVITASATGMWRALDRCRWLANGDADMMPVGIRNKDELLIPAAAVELVTTRPYPGGTRPAVRVDESGVTLGTFKTKTREDW